MIKTEVLDLKEKFGDERRTEIVPEAAGDFSEEDLIRQEAVLISVTQGSYVKRTPQAAYRAQRRGGRGVQGMRTKDEDEVVDLFSAHTLDHLLFFTNRGRVYGQRVFALPETARDGKGLPLVNFLNLAADERVTTLLVVPDFAAGGVRHAAHPPGQDQAGEAERVRGRAAQRHHRHEPGARR